MAWVLISLPIFEREWILDTWLAAIEAQDWPMSDIGFTFECANGDNATIERLVEFSNAHPEFRCFDLTINNQQQHLSHMEGFRTWNRDRYKQMAQMRNNILNRAKCYQPDRLFSLDSDIILEDKSTITELVKLTEDHDAVGTLLFMTPQDVDFPSVMTWAQGKNLAYRTRAYPLGTLFRADVIMASVMMSREVYEHSRYTFHPQGEDLGWSWDCNQRGYKLWSASYLYTAHIMSRAALEEYKVSGDPRKLLLSEDYFREKHA